MRKISKRAGLACDRHLNREFRQQQIVYDRGHTVRKAIRSSLLLITATWLVHGYNKVCVRDYFVAFLG